MTPPPDVKSTLIPAKVRTLGVVSFLNALPLYESLTGRADLTIVPAVPSRLGGFLAEGRCAAALLPVVAYWRERRQLTMISDACIASDGETMTVRVFSKAPPDAVRRLYVDGDSQTSVVLAQVVWREMYGKALELIPWNGGKEPRENNLCDFLTKRQARSCDLNAGGSGYHCVTPDGSDSEKAMVPPTASPGQEGKPSEPEAVLLIGDKVVRERPRGFGFEVDLGAAWKHLTGLPFVFAAWFGEAKQDHRALAEELRAARDAGVADAERIARKHASRHGWPVDLAVTYLSHTMRYTITDAMRAGMGRFFELAVGHGVLE